MPADAHAPEPLVGEETPEDLKEELRQVLSIAALLDEQGSADAEFYSARALDLIQKIHAQEARHAE